MKNIHQLYRKQIKDHLGYWASWLPDALVGVGDILEVNRQTGLTRSIGNIESFGINFAVTQSESRDTLKYYSEDTCFANVVAEMGNCNISDSPSGKLRLSFKRAGGVIFHANGCRESRMKDESAVGEEIMRRYFSGDWDEAQLVVTDVVRAQDATIIVSNSQDAEIILDAKSNIAPANWDFASVSTGLSVRQHRGIGFHLIARADVSPLFLVSQIKTTLLGQKKWGGKAVIPTRSESTVEGVSFEEVDPSVFLGNS